MPFTPSHAIVALPFVRTPFLPAAIAIGSMAPDLPLFVRGTALSYQATHTNVALATGIALVLLVLWYALLRPAVRELAPRFVAVRLPEEWDATGAAIWRSIRAERPGARQAFWRSPAVFAVMVVLSLLVGVVTHNIWDAFTHEGRWGVRLVPVIGTQWGPLPGDKWLQYGTSLVALVVLAMWGARWLRRRPPSPSHRALPGWLRVVWWLALPAALLTAWGIGLALVGPVTSIRDVQYLAYRALLPACAVWGLLTVALCVFVQVRRHPRPGWPDRWQAE